jgi:Molybdopterin-binding domain of aldehyde dehydrogenase
LLGAGLKDERANFSAAPGALVGLPRFHLFVALQFFLGFLALNGFHLARCCRRRHQPSRPPLARSRPGSPRTGDGAGDRSCAYEAEVIGGQKGRLDRSARPSKQATVPSMRVSILANLGAYLSPFGCFIPTRSTDLVSGLYSIEAIHINVKGVCTNTVPVCAYRGAGRPEAAYLHILLHHPDG